MLRNKRNSAPNHTARAARAPMSRSTPMLRSIAQRAPGSTSALATPHGDDSLRLGEPRKTPDPFHAVGTYRLPLSRRAVLEERGKRPLRNALADDRLRAVLASASPGNGDVRAVDHEDRVRALIEGLHRVFRGLDIQCDEGDHLDVAVIVERWQRRDDRRLVANACRHIIADDELFGLKRP